MSDIFKMPVFPAADVFPMMADEELKELAEDIKANGLREPLVIDEIDGETMLVDGRNRRAACKIAGVEPSTRTLGGTDPTAYVLSANVHRRNLSTGQRAMAIAMLRPEAERAHRGKKASRNGNLSDVPSNRVAEARAVLGYSPDLAKAVMRGEKPLQAALTEARYSQGSARNDRARLAKLREERPDLADYDASDVVDAAAA